MRSVYIYLCILLSSTCVRSQVTLLESGPGTVKPSDPLRLSCKVTGYSLTSGSYCSHWVRQRPGRGLEWLARICSVGQTFYPDSLKSRLTITRDTSASEFYLQISTTIGDDSGRYYCAREWGWSFDYWGPGTMVTVTGVEITKPQVFSLANCCASSSADGQLGVLAIGYMPGDLSYNWKNGSLSITSGIRTSPSTLSDTSDSYFSISVITAPRSGLESGSVSCTVEHGASSATITKNVQVDALCKPRAPPEATMMQTSCPERDGSGFVGVVCIGSSLSSYEFTVIFREDSKEVSINYNRSVSQASDGTYTVRIYTHMPQAKWNKGTILSCTITDTKTKKVASASLSRCADDYNDLGININLLAPTAEDLYINKKARVRCIGINLPDPSGATFTWVREKVNGTVTPVNQDPEQRTNGVYSQTSLLPVCVDEWQEGESFTCRLSHPKLTNPIQKTIFKDLNIEPIRPSVYVYGPTPEEVSRNEMVSITCIAKKFLPQDISIKWTKDGTEVDSGTYDTTPPQYMKATRDFVCASVLQMEAEVWKRGSVITCVVVHEGAAHNVIQQSVDKNSAAPILCLYAVDDEEKEIKVAGGPDSLWATFLALFILSLLYSTTVTVLKVK